MGIVDMDWREATIDSLTKRRRALATQVGGR